MYQYKNINIEAYAPWETDHEFLEFYNKIKDHTLVDIMRCYEIWETMLQVKKLNGQCLEVGVWKGGTGAIISHLTNSIVYLCDTFTGVVKTSDKDTHYFGGEHSDTNQKIVEDLFYKKLKQHNITILKGIFPEETSTKIWCSDIFKFCHIDVDVYESTKDILDWVLPRMVKNGIILIDDYGWKSCSGVTKVIDEYKTRKDLLFFYNLNGHAILIKR